MNQVLPGIARWLHSLAAPLLPCILAASLSAQPSLRITSPADGTVVSPGETLNVTVNASGGRFILVAVGGENPIGISQALAAPPYQFFVKIPSAISPRRYSVIAMGAVTPGQPVYSDPIEIVVEPAEPPKSLRVEPSLLDLRAGNPGILQVIATYPDGSTIYVSQSTKITYSSNSPDVATVSGDGRVTTVGPGFAKITVRYRDKTVVVPVTVRKRPEAPQQ